MLIGSPMPHTDIRRGMLLLLPSSFDCCCVQGSGSVLSTHNTHLLLVTPKLPQSDSGGAPTLNEPRNDRIDVVKVEHHTFA